MFLIIKKKELDKKRSGNNGRGLQSLNNVNVVFLHGVLCSFA